MTGEPRVDREALLEACRAVASVTLWQTPKPDTVDDIVDTDQIDRAVTGYFKHAEGLADDLAEAGHDPDFIVRAVRYLADEHALPPMRDDIRWFEEAPQVLVRLVDPMTSPSKNHVAFMAELESAARRYRREAQRD